MISEKKPVYKTKNTNPGNMIVKAALRTSEEKFKFMFEHSIVGKSFTLPSGEIHVNQAFCKMLGYFQEEFQNKTWQEITHPDDLELTERALNKIISDEEDSVRYTKRYIHKAGTVIWAEDNTSLLRDKDGRPRYFMTDVSDITARKQTEDALQLRNQFLIDLQNTTLELISQLDLNTLLENIVKRACALVGTSAGLLDLIDPATNQLVPKIGVGALEESLRYPVKPGEGLTGVIWQTGKILAIPDYDQWAGRLAGFSHGTLGSVIGVPLLSGTHVVGVLVIGSAYGVPHHFDTAAIEILTQFARLATVAVQNARLFSNLQAELTERKQVEEALQISEYRALQIAERLQIVNQIGLKITAGLDFETLMHTIYEQCQKIGDTDTFYIALLEATTGMLSFPFYYKDGEHRNIAARNIKDNAGLAGHIIESRQTFYTPDQNNLPAGVTLVRQPGRLTQSFIGVPLILNDQSIGVLSMQSHTVDAYSPEQIKMLEYLATQVAIAIQNSQLYRQVQQKLIERKYAEAEVLQLNARLEQRVEERTNELRNTQEQLIRQEKLALLGQLAANMGHELRNPLGVISNAAYYLQITLSNAEKNVQEYLSMIQNETHTAEKIITDLLDFSRNVSADPALVEVACLIQQTLEHFPAPPSVQVTLNIPADLPPIYADARQMEQVLGNLVLNACQAMPEGGKLTLSAKLKNKMIAIAVKDTGTGIAPENIHQIFEPLFTTKLKGIGLGLAVSKRLVEANGGRLEVQSQPGKGSTFTLVLPVKE